MCFSGGFNITIEKITFSVVRKRHLFFKNPIIKNFNDLNSITNLFKMKNAEYYINRVSLRNFQGI